jgi:hypothetical protein
MILGKSAAEAMAESGDLFTEITTGTPTWDVDCRANISSEFGDLTQRYQLSWTKS